ncbi:MAG: DUF4301 family protein [Prevotella sp.]|nr:DUF4301 family protein [Prevotella sp.]
MFTQEDIRQMTHKGIAQSQAENQLRTFEQGFPFLRIQSAATTGNGVFSPNGQECADYRAQWDAYTAERRQIVKFVPASGAASRMFKDLFAFLNDGKDMPETEFEQVFFSHIDRFAFYNALNAACIRNEGKDVKQLVAEGNGRVVVENLLEEKGLNYGQLPKGLLLFHDYADGARTPLEEHLTEGALYAAANGEVHIHFTVSHEHLPLFQQLVDEKKEEYEKRYGVVYHISFSEQKPSTDTIAVNPDNTPFRNVDNSLLFRPGGHGALIENLNDMAADVVFIKNIDNVVPEALIGDTVDYKKMLGGILTKTQEQVFRYLNMLEGECSQEQLQEMLAFTMQQLCCYPENQQWSSAEQLKAYLIGKLNRPMRVCGVVRNVGEPGGGPFLAFNADGTVSPQILESSQIDMANEDYRRMFAESTHFNPVDLVCAVKNYRGEPFDLLRHVDRSTGFISEKSKDGKPLKALELPGLWNGAMSDWNTVFVEVPLTTFNPVKTVNDLLRSQHQPA